MIWSFHSVDNDNDDFVFEPELEFEFVVVASTVASHLGNSVREGTILSSSRTSNRRMLLGGVRTDPGSARKLTRRSGSFCETSIIIRMSSGAVSLRG